MDRPNRRRQDLEDRAAQSVNQANAILRKAGDERSIGAVNQALQLYGRARGIAPTGWRPLSVLDLNEGNAYTLRWELGGPTSDLSRGVRLMEDALAGDLREDQRLAAEEHLRWARGALLRAGDASIRERARSALGLAESADARTTEGLELIDLASDRVIGACDGPRDMELVARALALIKSVEQAGLVPPSLLVNKGTLLRKQFEAGIEGVEIESVVDVLRNAYASVTGVNRVDATNALANALACLYEKDGDGTILDEVINLRQSVLHLLPAELPAEFRAGFLVNLSDDIYSRYRRTGRVDDLEEYVRLTGEAVSITPAGYPLYPEFLGAQAQALHQRYRFYHRDADLDEAIELLERAKSMTREKGKLARHMNSLGTAYMERSSSSNDARDLERSVRSIRSAIDWEPAAQARTGYQSNLGVALKKLYLATGDEKHLAASIEAHRTSVGQTSEESPLRVERELNLANALENQYDATKSEDVRNEARSLRERVIARGRTSNAEAAVRASRQWAAWAEKHAFWPDVVVATTALFDTVHALAQTQASRDAKEGWLRHIQDASVVGAWAALQLKDHEGAYRFLELGQAWLVMNDIARLHDVRDRLLLAGTQLPSACGVDAVVYIASAPRGHMLLVVTPRQTDATVGSVTRAELIDFLVGTGDGRTPGFLQGQIDGGQILRDLLEKPLDSIGSRLLDSILPLLEKAGAKRIALIACGPLGLLPLHACRTAGGAMLCEQFTITTAPNGRILADAYASLGDLRRGRLDFVGIGNAEPQTSPLPAAQVEVERIAEMLRGAEVETFRGPEALRQPVLDAAAEARILHFAVHGNFDLADPLNSSLRLFDGVVKARDILVEKLFPRARLVVLSACQTAITDPLKLRDERIGLTSSILASGVPGVISALWPVPDRWTGVLMERFYVELVHREPGEALRAAQAWLRSLPYAELVDMLDEYNRQLMSTQRLPAKEAGTAPESRVSRYHWAAFVYSGA